MHSDSTLIRVAAADASTSAERAPLSKSEALRLLGGSPTSAARLIGISAAAVSMWPDVLPPRIADRVQAALWRMSAKGDALYRRADDFDMGAPDG